MPIYSHVSDFFFVRIFGIIYSVSKEFQKLLDNRQKTKQISTNNNNKYRRTWCSVHYQFRSLGHVANFYRHGTSVQSDKNKFIFLFVGVHLLVLIT